MSRPSQSCVSSFHMHHSYQMHQVGDDHSIFSPAQYLVKGFLLSCHRERFNSALAAVKLVPLTDTILYGFPFFALNLLRELMNVSHSRCCCLPTPMALASGGSPMFPLVVHQPASPSIWPAVQSLRRGLSTNPGATMWCVCGCS